MAFKVLSGLQVYEPDRPLASAFPSGAYRVRFLHNTNAVTFGEYLGDLITAGTYALPYIETESTYPNVDDGGVPRAGGQTHAAWKTRMEAFAPAFAAAGVEYIEFGNEPNHPDDITRRHALWDAYILRLENSAPIFREAGVGVMMAGIGNTRYTQEWFNYLAGKKAFRCVDAVAIHAYSGGFHQDGTVGGGLPADTQRKVEDARASLSDPVNGAAPNRPELDFYITEFGWPTEFWETTKTCDTTAGSQTVNVGSNTGLTIGWLVNGPRIQGGTTITAKPTSSTITISKPALGPNAVDITLYFGGQGTDEAHPTYCTPAQQATRLSDCYTRLYNVAAANRLRVLGWFHSSDYRSTDDLWNASTNTPTLANGTGDGGTFYEVSVAGTQNFGAGNITFAVGEYVRYNGTAWVKVAKPDTPGGWAHHHGLQNEPGTARYIATPHKPSWQAFVDDVGIGRATSGVKPDVTTSAATNVTNTGATIPGTVHPHNEITEWRVQYGLDENYGSQTTTHSIPAGAAPVPVNQVLPNNLLPGRVYHFRVIAWSDKGNSWGDRLTFTTTGGGGVSTVIRTPRRAATGSNLIDVDQPVSGLVAGEVYHTRIIADNSAGTDVGDPLTFATTVIPSGPTATTGSATNPGLTSATLNGIVDPDGGANIEWHFEYGLDSDLGTIVPIPAGTVSGATPVPVSHPLIGLIPNRTYFYQLSAANGAAVGSILKFVTTSPATEPPEIFPPDEMQLALSVEIETADGRFFRWDFDDADPRNRPLNKRFGTHEGDGFAEASCTLHRPIGLNYSDLILLDIGRFIGADGSTAYEGRITGRPATVDEEGEWIEVQFQGLMASARDRPFVEVYADRLGDRWQDPSPALRKAIMADNSPLDTDYSVTVDAGSIHFKGVTEKAIPIGSQTVLVYRPPNGVKIAAVQYVGDQRNVASIEGARIWGNDLGGVIIGQWKENILATLNGDGLVREARFIHDSSPWEFIALRMARTSAGVVVVTSPAHRHWETICVYGDHSVPLRANDDEPDGVWASDVFKDIVERFCPLLDASDVVETTFVISHLVFDTPTDPYDGLTELNGYHMYMMGVWEGGKVQWEPPDRDDADWIVRKGEPGVGVNLQGETTDDFANGVVVSYRDAQDRERILWPDDHESLRDDDLNNPANRAGYPKWIKLEISSPVTGRAALALGEAALQDFNHPKASGTITIASGHILSKFEHLEPAWKPRANQSISITNLPNDESRLINSTNWDEDSKQLSITLEKPPSAVDAVLARLGLALQIKGI